MKSSDYAFQQSDASKSAFKNEACNVTLPYLETEQTCSNLTSSKAVKSEAKRVKYPGRDFLEGLC